MKIETKKNMGQKQYFLFQNRIESADIFKIQIVVDNGGKDKRINYFLNTPSGCSEELHQMFDTKQELIKSLLEAE